MLKPIRKRTLLLSILLVVFLCGISYVYCIYHGYLLLNNPSGRKYPIVGVDVSHYQGIIDWNTLSQQDIQFAFMKATEGSSHIDAKFADNWEQTSNLDLKTGAYHFFSFDSPGETQAANFITTVGKRKSMLPPVVDVEYYADKKVNPPEPQPVRDQLQAMLDELEAYYGTAPIIYSTEEVWERYLNGYFDDYPLWIRNVFTKPKIQNDWTFWQYTNRARLKGYSGDETFIDLNVFDGSEDEWSQWITTHTVS